MIKSERQLAVSRRKRDQLLTAAASAEGVDRDVYQDLASEVNEEIDEYLALREGDADVFSINSVDDLAEALVKARIARRWTQKQLADALGVTEQQVQKDEARGYENAGLARIADIFDVLRFDLSGEIHPVEGESNVWKRYRSAHTSGTSIVTTNFDRFVEQASNSFGGISGLGMGEVVRWMIPSAPYQGVVHSVELPLPGARWSQPVGTGGQILESGPPMAPAAAIGASVED